MGRDGPYEVACMSVILGTSSDDKFWACILFWIIIIGLVLVVPLSFALAADVFESEQNKLSMFENGKLTSSFSEQQILRFDDYGFGESVSLNETEDFTTHILSQSDEPASLFFELLGGYSDFELGAVKIPLVIGLTCWGFYDVAVSFSFVYSKFQGDRNTKAGTACLILLLQIIAYILEFWGFFFQAGGWLLLIWPVSNVIRVVDGIVVLIFRSKVECLSKCYHSDYNVAFKIMDFFGTGAGIMMYEDAVWEKVVNIVYELIDTIFSFAYVINELAGSPTPPGVLNVFCFFKVVSIGLKIAVSFKGMVSFGSYVCSLGVGCLMAFIAVATLLFVQLRSMHVIMVVRYVVIMIPLMVAVVVVMTVIGVGMKCDIRMEESEFYTSDTGDEDTPGECLLRLKRDQKVEPVTPAGE